MKKIGELSKITGCSVQAIRHYEKELLITASKRTHGNFRLYGEEAIEQLMFIKDCRSLDLSLPEITQLLALKGTPHAQCDDVNRMMGAHIEHVETRIRDLTKLREQLKTLKRNCSNQQTIENCGILRSLSATPD